MNKETVFRTVLKEQTEAFLRRLRAEGCKNPQPRHVNNGLCFAFAESVVKIANRRLKKYAATDGWPSKPPFHAAVYYRGKWYDAECHHGTLFHKDLPYMVRIRAVLGRRKAT